MKAMVYDKYGTPEVLQLKEVEKPSPGPDEVLVKVYAVSVNYGDLIARNFSAVSPRKFTMPLPLWLPARMDFGWRTPRKQILGNEFAGVIDTVGQNVKRYQSGDPVFGYRGQKMGAYAEYLTMPEDGNLALKPADLSFEEAAVLPYGALTALNLLRKVNVQDGHKVLINGASGGIGSAAVQLCKYYGAEVTGVCGTPRLDFVKALGADQVIDYKKENFTESGETYDLIFDILGKSSFSQCKNSLKTNGRYLLASFKMKQVFQMFWTSLFGSSKVICALSMEKAEDMQFIKKLIETGNIISLIDRRYPLEQVAEAHRYVESGQKKGSVVLTVDHREIPGVK